jgi:hypothetical protein
MAANVGRGGYVVTTRSENWLAYQVTVDDQTLSKVAEVLGIEPDLRKKLTSEIRSIYIFRGR